jgi:hypothetical protein
MRVNYKGVELQLDRDEVRRVLREIVTMTQSEMYLENNSALSFRPPTFKSKH